MKIRILTALLAASTVLSTSAMASLDIGYELGATKFASAGLTKTRPNNMFRIGYMNEAGLGVDGIYAYIPKTKFGYADYQSDYKVRMFKVMAKYRKPFGEKFSALARAGVGFEHVTNNLNAPSYIVKSTIERYFPTFSGGAYYNVTEQVSLGVNVHYDARSHYRFSENVYPTIGINYTIPSSI